MNTHYFRGIKFLVPFILIIFSFCLSCIADDLPFLPIAPSQCYLNNNGVWQWSDFVFMNVSGNSITYSVAPENQGYSEAILYFDLQEIIYNDISFDLTIIPAGTPAVGTPFSIDEISAAVFFDNSSVTEYTNIYGNNLNRAIRFNFKPNTKANKLRIDILNNDTHKVFTRNGFQVKFSNISINNAIFSVASEINQKIDSSTQEIIENQNDNTQAIIDNQNENHRELMDADTEEHIELPEIPSVDFPSPTGPSDRVLSIFADNIIVFYISSLFLTMQNNIYLYLLIWLCFMSIFVPFIVRLLKR